MTASSETETTSGGAFNFTFSPETFKAAQSLVREKCPDVSFCYDGETYYGVPEQYLTLLPNKDRKIKTMLTAMHILGSIATSVQDHQLTELLSAFDRIYGDSMTDARRKHAQSFLLHARRVLYRLILCLQGFYDRHWHPRAALDQPSAGKRGSRRTDAFWIFELYTDWPQDWTAQRYLKDQLFKLPRMLERLIAEMPLSMVERSPQPTLAPRSTGNPRLTNGSSLSAESAGYSSSKRTKKSHVTEPVELTAQLTAHSTAPTDSLVVALKIRGWHTSCDISRRQVLHQLALDGLKKDANPNPDEEVSGYNDIEAILRLEVLVGAKYAAQLPGRRQRYLLDELLPAIKSSSENLYYHLAMVLGYFDWSRENPPDAEVQPFCLYDEDGQRDERLWSRALALLCPGSNVM